MHQRKLIIFLLFLAILVIVVAFTKPLERLTQIAKPNVATKKQELPDAYKIFVGKIIFHNEGKLYELVLPSLTIKQLRTPEYELLLLPRIRSNWSGDGNKLAFALNDKIVAVADYLKGEQLGAVELSEAKANFTISLSADGEYLAVGSNDTWSVYNVRANKLLGSVSGCGNVGVWLKVPTGMAVRCSGSIQILLPNQDDLSVDKILTRAGDELLDYQVTDNLVILRDGKLGTLSLDGNFRSASKETINSFPTQDAIKNPQKALMHRIADTKNIKDVDDLDVSSLNQFIVFHTVKGLWLIDIELKNEPFFLSPGEMPSVMPLF